MPSRLDYVFFFFTLVPGLLAGAVAWIPNLVFLEAKVLGDFFSEARYLYGGFGLDLADFVVLLDLETLRFTRWREGDGDTGTNTHTTHQNIRIKKARHDKKLGKKV